MKKREKEREKNTERKIQRKFTCKYKLCSCYHFLFYQNELRAYSSIKTQTHTQSKEKLATGLDERWQNYMN